MSKPSNRQRDFIEWVAVVVLALGLAFGVRTIILQPFRVQMGSMMPTIRNDDLILVNKLAYLTHGPDRGDIIVFRPPNSPSHDEEYIKRVIGLPGEWVDYDRDTKSVYINGILLIENMKLSESDYTQEISPPSTEGHKRGIKLEEGEYYVLGDNRDSSKDSRFFGAISDDSIIGEAFIIFWPANRFSVLQ
ncbi:MAG TPA: signal peptidase I [Caldisericia bacterium]|nr:signal peptidase I [Caldisericia bacterium]